MAARAYPDARFEILCLCSDWISWLFIADDQYDEGRIGMEPGRLSNALDRFVAILSPGGRLIPVSPLEIALGDMKQRMLDLGATQRWVERFKASNIDYFGGCVQEARHRASGTLPTVDEYRKMRRSSVGILECFDLIELSILEFLPKSLVENDDLRSVRENGADVSAWVNDLVSFDKESKRGDPSNLLVALMSETGCDAKTAAVMTVEIHNTQMRDLLAAEARLAENLRGDYRRLALRYSAGIKDWVRGSYDWMLRSSRYESYELAIDSDSLLGSADSYRSARPLLEFSPSYPVEVTEPGSMGDVTLHRRGTPASSSASDGSRSQMP